MCNSLKHRDGLKAALPGEGTAIHGEPVLASYNAPFTLWFMLRNEMWLTLT
jgi:hypothetical protein